MDFDLHPKLLDIDEQPVRQKSSVAVKPKLKTVNRSQTMLAHICVEELIPADHRARAIWDLAGTLDLSGFTENVRSSEGCVGRPTWEPRLLVSLWIYAYSEGIGSAREIERLMEWEPGLQWLGGLETVNHHTLSDFRVDHKAALDELFAQLLALLEGEGLVSLDQVMHDGTKIRAQAGADSFRREKSILERLDQARQVVAAMGDPEAEGSARDRKKAAQRRAQQEQAQRMEAALKELQDLQAQETTAKEKADVRVSITEPEARKMKHGDAAIAPSYNAQITTEAGNKIIVGAHLSQNSSDAQSLMPSLDVVADNLNRKPSQVVVDGGYTNRPTIIQCAEQQIDLVGSLRNTKESSESAVKANGIDAAFAPHHFRILEEKKSVQCPAGCTLQYVRQSSKKGDRYLQYRARKEDCQTCRYQPQCCPKAAERGRTISIRVSEHAEMVAFRKKMDSDEYRAIYRRRGEVAEFPNAWIKDKLGLRKFRVRGLVKAGSELVWACLTYNIMQWVRLIWRKAATA